MTIAENGVAEQRNDDVHWTRVAEQWIAWARAPGHDAFWAYRDAFARFVGTGTGAALEIGCGEGRVSRELRKLGYHVTASDAVGPMVEAARAANSADIYATAYASSLPFEPATFDLVVAYNMLMDVDDVAATLHEARRMLKPQGVLVVSVVHPFRIRGAFDGRGANAPFVLKGSYFGRERFDDDANKGGLRMHFNGWALPLEAYAASLEEAGFAITSLREPVPDSAAAHQHPTWSRMPLFLWLKARPLA